MNECENCKHHNPKEYRAMMFPCKIHPFCIKNRNDDCPDYKTKWWKFWIKETL
jgi:hypothetical protein